MRFTLGLCIAVGWNQRDSVERIKAQPHELIAFQLSVLAFKGSDRAIPFVIQSKVVGACIVNS